jgi:hypothetical protein
VGSWKTAPWRKLPFESAEHYGSFAEYLHSGEGPSRNFAEFIEARPALYPVAQEFLWYQRGEAYDDFQRFKRTYAMLPFTSKAACMMKRLIEGNLERMCETFDRCERETLKPSEVATWVNLLKDLDRLLIAQRLIGDEALADYKPENLPLEKQEILRELLLECQS